MLNVTKNVFIIVTYNKLIDFSLLCEVFCGIMKKKYKVCCLMLYQFKEPIEYKKLPSSFPVILVKIILPIIITIFVIIFTLNTFASVFALIISLIVGFIITWDFPYNKVKRENFELFRSYHDFRGSVKILNFSKRIPKLPNVNMAAWSKKNELHICANEQKDDFGEVIIPFENIVFFVRDGDFYTKTEISRNGRIVGGLIAGPTGFLTGTNTTATTIEVDKRQTILYLENDGNEETWFFDSQTYNSLMEIIPQFEYKKVVSKPKNNDVAPASASKPDNLEQIKKLKELLDIGAISQDEFDSKKQELLNKM